MSVFFYPKKKFLSTKNLEKKILLKTQLIFLIIGKKIPTLLHEF
jgi:hypothetical protein